MAQDVENAMETTFFRRYLFSVEKKQQSVQGMAIHNGIMVQAYHAGLCGLYDLSSHEKVGELQLSHGSHCTNLSFGPEYYDSNDEFPLLYITNNQDNYDLYVDRIDRKGMSLVQTIKLPESYVNYYPIAVIDKENRFLYVLSYKQKSYTDSTNNFLLLTKMRLPY